VLEGELLTGHDTPLFLEIQPMPLAAHDQLRELLAKHNREEEEVVSFLCGYVDIVNSWLSKPCLPGSLPLSFDEYVEALDLALAGDPVAD
jgi:hypothetical protein